MIHETSGDLLLSTSPVIVHGVAPNDDFHSGLALLLREQFPAMYKNFRHYCHVTHPKAGEIWAWSGVGRLGTVTIVSLLTQDGGYEHGAKPGPAHLDFVNHALKRLRHWIETERPASVAMPKLATGVGGLDWKHVFPLIKQHLGDLEVPVHVYGTYHAGQQAHERAVPSGTPRTL